MKRRIEAPHTREKLPKNSAWADELRRRALKKHYIKALVELDVTELRKKIKDIRRCSGKSVSFFALLVKTITDTLHEQKEVHACKSKKNEKIIFHDIDISIPVERIVDGKKMPMPYVLRGANGKSIWDIHKEISEAKYRMLSDSEQVLSNPISSIWIQLFPHLPKWMKELFWKRFEKDPHLIKELCGTVGITSTTMPGTRGWGIPLSIQPLCFSLGGITKREVLIDGAAQKRDFLCITILFDHDTVDGAPASRFVSCLRKHIENRRD